MSNISPQLYDAEINVDLEPVPKRIGLIALATDHTSEHDFAQLIDPLEVGLYVNRIAYENPTTPENLKLTGPRLTEAVATLLPDEKFDVIAYGCTAASVVLGNSVVEDYIQKAKPNTPCVTPSSAAFAAFKALGKKRVSVLTPYTQDVTTELVTYFEENGLEVVNANCLGFQDDRQMARIAHSSLIEAAVDAMHPDADALFISCTALRALGCIEQVEAQIAKPVVTSNQAVIWDCFRKAGIERSIKGYGKLFEEH